MKRLTTALAGALLLGSFAVGAPSVANAGPGGSALSAPVGSASMHLADCLWGPYGPMPYNGDSYPAVVASQKCVSVTLYTGEDTFEAGSAQITLPAGMSISKKVAGPSGGLFWAPPSDCWWSGSFSVLATGRAQTLRLNNLWCDPDETLTAFFSAKVLNPVDVDYPAFTAGNQLSMWHYYYEYEGCTCEAIWEGFPFLMGGTYSYMGSYVPVKYGATYQLYNANYYEPGRFLVAPDNDYFRWWQWLLAEVGWCFGPH